jgi:thioredoxin-dependent peroxiredoxin
MLHPGSPAPAFQARDQQGTDHALRGYRGRWILLYFYPKDDTPGCTAEACGLRDRFDELSLHAVVLGVSKDDAESHRGFARKYGLPFPLLVDSDCAIITAYGVGTAFPKRVSFLIDPEGTIATIYDTIDCALHAQEVLRYLVERSGEEL